MANRVSVLTENPSKRKTVKEPMMATGTASIGISVARQLSRNTKTTSNTSTTAMPMVICNSRKDASTNNVVSKGMEYLIPAGKLLETWRIVANTRCASSSALASGS